MNTAENIMKKKAFIKAEIDKALPRSESDELWRKATERLADILDQHSSLPKGVRAHTDNFIFPSAAIYMTAKEAVGQEKAYSFVENAAIALTEICRALSSNARERWAKARTAATSVSERYETMKEKDLPIDFTKHAVYTKNAKKCVRKLLDRYYDRETAEDLWEKIQMKYAEYLEDEPALGGVRITTSIYDPILIFAWYEVIPEKPDLEDVQQDIYESFFGSFDLLGKIFDLNRKRDNRLANRIFQKTNDIRVKEIERFPESFRMGYNSYDKENGIVRYSFTQCPNAEFAKRHHMEDVLPVMCNCDHLAMQKLHACLIRESTCVTSDHCDYLVVGDRNPLTDEYELVRTENGLMISVKKGNGLQAEAESRTGSPADVKKGR